MTDSKKTLATFQVNGEPHEVAGLVVLLAGRAGAFITGQNLVVDGGTLVSDGG